MGKCSLYLSTSLETSSLSIYSLIFDPTALRPTNPYLHPSKNTNTCDSPYNILNSLFWALSQSGKMWCVAFSPHKKTLVKSTYMRFPIQKVKFAFLGPFCLRGSNRESSVTVTPESNHRRLLLKQVLALRKNFSLGIITCIHNITEIKPHPGLSLHTKNMYIITRVYIHHTHQKQDNFLDKFPH